MFFPPGTQMHDAEYWMADKPPIDLGQIILSPGDLRVLGIFSRDLRELLATALYKNGPGSLCSLGGQWVLKTAVSDEEIRSFVTIFRRLYMQNEPANFTNAVGVFAVALAGHPVTKWVQTTTTGYSEALEQPPDAAPILGVQGLPFTRKRLIDVYLYTQYAHQPDERRTRQYSECLTAVGGNRSALTWLFLREIWKATLAIHNAGVVIAEFYDRYCQAHHPLLGVLPSLSADHHGLGALEKKADQEARVLREKAEELAKTLWEHAGKPAGGHGEWVKPALAELMAAIGRTDGARA